jgi:NAD(P)H-dependent FMN reductase
MMPKLSVIVASVREGRMGDPIAQWFMKHAQAYGKFDVQLVDLKDVNLPLLSEPHHPRLRKYQQEGTKAWSATIGASDAFVFVTPEYNYNMPPALVNALDHLYHEWSYKACAFVSYGGLSAGTRSVQMARQMATGFKMMPMVEAVNIPFFSQLMENGVFKGNEAAEKMVAPMLDELLRWTDALKVLRTS